MREERLPGRGQEADIEIVGPAVKLTGISTAVPAFPLALPIDIVGAAKTGAVKAARAKALCKALRITSFIPL